MHIDATSIPVRDKETGYQVNLGALWGYVGGKECAVYLYASTGKKVGQRKGEVGPEEFLALRSGYVVADAANIFDKSFKSERLIEVGCNMHGRRRFVQALEGKDERAAFAVAAFQTLYDVEDCVRDADDETRQKERQARSKPVYEALIVVRDLQGVARAVVIARGRRALPDEPQGPARPLPRRRQSPHRQRHCRKAPSPASESGFIVHTLFKCPES